MRCIRSYSAIVLLVASASLLAADAGERKFIRKGMAEEEVLHKIGKPDHEAIIRAVKGQPEEKSWTYFPHPRDAQTLTIITFHAGTVSSIERKIAR